MARTHQTSRVGPGSGRGANDRPGHEAEDGPRSGAKRARERLLADLPVTERRLELAGVSTSVLEGGEGPPLILLHGPGEYAAKWRRVIPALIADHGVIAPDLPGHGTSEVRDGPLHAERALEWLGELIRRTCREPPIVVGQIVGGAIAARYAARHAGDLDALVLADSLGLAPFRPSPDFGSALAAFLRGPSGETHDRLWECCAHDLGRLREGLGGLWESLRAYNLDRARSPNVQAALHSLMEGFGMPAIPHAELARITVRTILIWGRHDLATPLGVAEAASARYGWPLYVLEDAADDPPLEQPEAFLGALRSALGTS